MSTKRLGIIMHGVTGRMGMNQHLIRSILAIRKQGVNETGYHPWPDDGTSWSDPTAYTEFESHIAKDIHNGGANYGFADGHAKWLQWSSTVRPSYPGMHYTLSH